MTVDETLFRDFTFYYSKYIILCFQIFILTRRIASLAFNPGKKLPTRQNTNLKTIM